MRPYVQWPGRDSSPDNCRERRSGQYSRSCTMEYRTFRHIRCNLLRDGMSQGHHLSRFYELRDTDDFRGRDQIACATLIVRPPSTPVPELRSPSKIVGRGDGRILTLCPGRRAGGWQWRSSRAAHTEVPPWQSVNLNVVSGTSTLSLFMAAFSSATSCESAMDRTSIQGPSPTGRGQVYPINFRGSRSASARSSKKRAA